MFDWTDERVEVAKKLWLDGYSAGDIANRLGGVSRNAVLGKMHRLGLSNKRNGRATGTLTSKLNRRARKEKELRAAPKPQPIFFAEPLPPPSITDVARIKTIADLEPHHCRWPINEPGSKDFGWCGEKKLIGCSYCAAHLQRSFRAPATLETKQQAALKYATAKTIVFEDA